MLLLLHDTHQEFSSGKSQARALNTAEKHSTRYDSDLGWVAIPNFHNANFYGEGRSLKTERHGFRNDQDVSKKVPQGTIRIICSGDSFTLGYGVTNEDTWCHQLGLQLGAETINMGQGGYGIDQAYLWYCRDGAHLEHHIHLLAFIGDDFRRAQKTETIGFAKPRLELIDKKLVVTNVPVPKQLSSLRRKLRGPTSQLRVIQAANGIRDRIRDLGLRNRIVTKPVSQSATLEIVTAMLHDLAARNQAKMSHLALVYLPVKEEYTDGDITPWRKSIHEISADLKIPYIDLQPHLAQLPEAELAKLFIQPGEVPFAAAAGHYSQQGNLWAATLISSALLNTPQINTLLTANPDLQIGH